MIEANPQAGQRSLSEETDMGSTALYGLRATWIDGLPSPHPGLSRVYGSEHRPLGTRIDVAAAEQELIDASEAGNEQYGAKRLEIAERVSRVVQQTLYFSPGYSDPKTSQLIRPSLEQVSSEGVATCYGFTLVTSSLLERIGVEHGIGFVNGHAFITLFVGADERTSAWLIDSHTPDFNQDMARLNPSISFQNVKQQSEANGRAATTISTLNFASSRGTSVQEMVDRERRVWLMKPVKPDEDPSAAETLARRTRVTLNVFDMNQGRIALERNLGYMNALARGRWAAAAHEVIGMAGFVPEADPDSATHERILQLVAGVCLDGGVPATVLTAALEGYFSSFGPQPTGYVARMHDECRRLTEQFGLAS